VNPEVRESVLLRRNEEMSESNVLIRAYAPGDLETLRQITVSSFGSVAVDEMMEQRYGVWNERDWKARKADHINDDVAANAPGCFVAECGGRLVGYITTRVDTLNGVGRIPNLAVTEEMRGQGLGRRLIDHALDYFRREGMALAKIETMASNPIGQKLYPACGFEEVGRQVHYAMRL
jgi:ribosomal protein S18 acetylase RimI-like enzyme